MPATGYELVEGTQAIGAVQYYGGGAFGLNQNIIWIHQGLDPEMQLMLAAAMTTVLQTKYNALAENP